VSKKKDSLAWENVSKGQWDVVCSHNSSSGHRLRESALNHIRVHADLYEPLYIAMGMPETFLVNTYVKDEDGNPVKERLTPSEIAYIAKGLKHHG